MIRQIPSRRGCLVAWLLFVASNLPGCADDPAALSTGELPAPSGALFAAEVYPVLLRDCAFSACHGASERFLHLVGPGRTRLEATTKPDDPVTLAEVVHSYDRCRSMLAGSRDVQRTLLLGKPLAIESGGQGHHGVDDFGRNLYATTRDPRYALLVRWASSRGLPPTAADVDALAAAAAVEGP